MAYMNEFEIFLYKEGSVAMGYVIYICISKKNERNIILFFYILKN